MRRGDYEGPPANSDRLPCFRSRTRAVYKAKGGIAMRLCVLPLALCLALLASAGSAARHPEGGYHVLKAAKVGGDGGFDYVYADTDGRRLYIPRSGGATGRVTVFDLDTLKSVGEIPNTNGVHGVAIAPKSHHGFSSSKPVVMFDTKTLKTVK